MPKRLINRCQPDSIREFRLAAQERFQDGLALAGAGRRTAAIYLWGYSAEATLKAAYFRAIGFKADQVIAAKDLNQAVSSAIQYGIHWQGNWHRIDLWARLLVSVRMMSPPPPYQAAGFDSQLLARSLTVAVHWQETLRYRKNVAYWHEVARLRESAAWLQGHSYEL